MSSRRVGVLRPPRELSVWGRGDRHGLADVHPEPLKRPRAPWVATRHEPAAEEHAAMLPVLGEVVRVLAWTLLRVQAYYEQQKREDEDE